MAGRHHARLIVLACAAAVAGACTDRAPTAPDVRADQGAAGAHRIIVMKSGATTMAGLATQIQALGGQVVRAQPQIGVLTAAGLTTAASAVIANRSDVLGLRQDTAMLMIPPRDQLLRQVVRGQSDQSGAFFFALQWNLRQIEADKAWLATNQGSGSLVCVLDTGVDPNQLDLRGKVDLGISTSFVTSEPDIIDHNLHGTAVSALISSNGLGMASVAPDAKLCAVKVLDAQGEGSFTDVIAGIIYAADHGADVINMSLGAHVTLQTAGDAVFVTALQRAIDYAIRHGTVPVAASGNEAIDLAADGPRAIELPGQLAGVIDVGATAPVDQQDFDRIASYSNFGFPGVDVFAPGGDFVTGSVLQDLIFTACAGSAVPECADEISYLIADGTSLASPHVAGEAAVIGSDVSADTRVAKVTTCIELTSDHPTGRVVDPSYGFGRIDVLHAASCASP